MTFPFRHVPTLAALLFACGLSAHASDEIPGRVADVLTAIREKSVGKVYELSGVLVVPPADDASYFAIRDATGAVAIRRGMDWPSPVFKVGDTVRVRCEIGATAQIPVGAFYESMALVARNPAFKVSRNLFVRTDGNESVEVLGLPTFLTPLRVLIALAALALVLFLIFLWNSALRTMIARKSRALLREQIGHIKAELKAEERTRLAIELHDSLAQSLTGVSLEIDTANRLAESCPATVKAPLQRAAQTLKSCRDELRNCLWDLRNRALEAKTMNEAIRLTLAPHVADAEIAVRFNVPRDRLSDNTAHMILRIVRELTLNGIRHGHATKVRIAGSVTGDQLLFSVADNGGGFDPASAPGFAEGHYGLLGIRERIDEAEGTFTVTSAPGQGARAVVTLAVPQETPRQDKGRDSHAAKGK